MPKAHSGYFVECSNPSCWRYHVRIELGAKPINRPSCQICAAEAYVYGPPRVGPAREDNLRDSAA